ncbi:ef hand domain-containing protein, partial [Cystoisospora suis]
MDRTHGQNRLSSSSSSPRQLHFPPPLPPPPPPPPSSSFSPSSSSSTNVIGRSSASQSSCSSSSSSLSFSSSGREVLNPLMISLSSSSPRSSSSHTSVSTSSSSHAISHYPSSSPKLNDVSSSPPLRRQQDKDLNVSTPSSSSSHPCLPPLPQNQVDSVSSSSPPLYSPPGSPWSPLWYTCEAVDWVLSYPFSLPPLIFPTSTTLLSAYPRSLRFLSRIISRLVDLSLQSSSSSSSVYGLRTTDRHREGTTPPASSGREGSEEGEKNKRKEKREEGEEEGDYQQSNGKITKNSSSSSFGPSSSYGVNAPTSVSPPYLLLPPRMFAAFQSISNLLTTFDDALWIKLRHLLHKPNDAYALHSFLIDITARLKSLPPGGTAILPGGVSLDADSQPSFLLFLVHRCVSPSSSSSSSLSYSPSLGGGSEGFASARYHFALINSSGYGSEFHAYRLEGLPCPGSIQRDFLLVFEDVIPDHLLHSSFWFSVYRLLLSPSPTNIHHLYTVLLPHLNGKPLLHNWLVLPPSSPPYNSHASSYISLSHEEDSLQTSSKSKKEEDKGKLSEFLSSLGASVSTSKGGKSQQEPSGSKNPFSSFSSVAQSKTGGTKLGGCWRPAPQLRKAGSSIQGAQAAVTFLLRCYGLSEDETKAAEIFLHLGFCVFLLDDLRRVPPPEQRSFFFSSPSSFTSSRLFSSSSFFSSLFKSSKTSTPMFSITYDRPQALLVSLAVRCVGRLASDYAWSLGFSPSSPFLSLNPHEDTSSSSSSLSSSHSPAEDSSGVLTRKQYQMIYSLLSDVKGESVSKLSLSSRGFGRGSCTLTPHACSVTTKFAGVGSFPLFGRFRHDDRPLPCQAVGEVTKPSILLPVDLSSVGERIDDMDGVLQALRKAVEACVILGNQEHSLPHTYCYRFQLIVDLLLRVLPLPLPPSHPLISQSFWHSAVLRRDTQIELLRLLHCLAPLRYNFPRHSPPSSLEFYLSGEKPEFLDFFPELLYLRDIVFTFKSLMTPEATSLPDLKRWSLADATLRWRYDLVKQTYTVTAFQKSLSCELFGKDKKLDYYEKASPQQGHLLSSSSSSSSGGVHSRSIFQRFVHWLGVREKPRAPPSGADPTNLLYFTNESKTITSSSSSSGGGGGKTSSSSPSVHERITCEEDVLHVKKLPTFNRRLRLQDCELLLQYLTVPYIRIPLITQFFTEEGRIDCLSVSALQHVLEAVLFEPWQHQKDEKKEVPEAIPPSNREYFATPLGLLFNELIYSPDVLLSSLLELLEIAIDKDTGYYNSPNASILLYIIRLIVRLQGYVLFILRFHLYWEEHRDGGKVPTLAEIDLLSRRSRAHSSFHPCRSRCNPDERERKEEAQAERHVALARGERGGELKKEEEEGEPGRSRERWEVEGEKKNEEGLQPSSTSFLPISRNGWRSRVRGLQCPSAKTLEHLKAWNRKLESRLHGEILHILETWAYK